MSITKPLYRIVRPMKTNDMFYKYVLDSRYANDMSMLCRSYKMLESDIKKVFEYVEPSDDNNSTYSHRIYELFLRASTEFESNCKRILEANGYSKPRHLDITDYHKINTAMRLSEYEVYIDIWRPQRKKIEPLLEWQAGHSLTWYQHYNQVKHNRQTEFNRANLDNLIQAVASVYVILFAQFGVYSFNPYQQINMVGDNDYGSIFSEESIFSIIPPNWPDNEKYDFDWETLKSQQSPFTTFNFV